jgi:hypothetical protein
MDEVILDGQWSAEKRLADLSADARHDLFLDELSQFSNGWATFKTNIEDLNDHELTGALAVALFAHERGAT